MKKKILVVFFIFIFTINFIVVRSFALTNDIQNGKLRVIFNRNLDGLDVKVRTSEYDNMIALSDAEYEEVSRDPVDIDYSNVDLFEMNNRFARGDSDTTYRKESIEENKTNYSGK